MGSVARLMMAARSPHLMMAASSCCCAGSRPRIGELSRIPDSLIGASQPTTGNANCSPRQGLGVRYGMRLKT
jgi:hypothetical protein